ncbi:hypothetical protein [Methanosarcina barkeri]|uniref:hypothetical protein n=1 Tax=Methanosarcina barkeri TaxID=2208 RepID=UPI000AEB6896|nr:hypothetical protein [Methanosarcina barkeri]
MTFRKEVAKAFEDIGNSETEPLINALKADPQNIKKYEEASGVNPKDKKSARKTPRCIKT